MIINNETAGILATVLKERLEEMLKKEETQVFHGTTKHDIPYRITIKNNPASKLQKVEVNICAQTRVTASVPCPGSNTKTNRAFALTTLYTKVTGESITVVFDIIMQSIREQDVLLDVLNGVTNEVKVVTPLGIDIYCHTDQGHRVFQITKAGKQVYAFEEALNIEDGGELEMMRPTKDLFDMSTTILRKAFIEGNFGEFQTEVLL